MFVVMGKSIGALVVNMSKELEKNASWLKKMNNEIKISNIYNDLQINVIFVSNVELPKVLIVYIDFKFS